MKPQQKNYPQEEKLVEIYEKHVGMNQEHEYLPTPKSSVLEAMEEFAEYLLIEFGDLYVEGTRNEMKKLVKNFLENEIS